MGSYVMAVYTSRFFTSCETGVSGGRCGFCAFLAGVGVAAALGVGFGVPLSKPINTHQSVMMAANPSAFQRSWSPQICSLRSGSRYTVDTDSKPRTTRWPQLLSRSSVRRCGADGISRIPA